MFIKTITNEPKVPKNDNKNNLNCQDLAIRNNCNTEPLYLQDYPTLRKRDENWDFYRSTTQTVEEIFSTGEHMHQKQARRLHDCTGFLSFAWVEVDGQKKLKLTHASFCKVRSCPVCQWRKSMVWQARFFSAMPKILEQFPKHRWLMLTLTVRNCHISELRDTVREMQKGFRRLKELKAWPATGYVKALEVTRGQDGTAHPHFHILMMVPSSYFGRPYIKTEKWSELWRQSMRLDYSPVVDVRSVKSKTKNPDDISSAVVEVLKYEMKVAELQKYPDFLLELAKQIKGLRMIEIGGALKNFLKSDEQMTDDELVGENEESEAQNELIFEWQRLVRRYQRKTL